MKKFLFVTIATIILALVSVPTVFGAGNSISVNGTSLNADKLTAYNDGGTRLYIKLSEVASLFDVKTSFNNNKAVIEKNGHTLSFEAGKNQFIMDNLSRRDLDCEGVLIKNGEPYIPIRALCEAIGASVKWAEGTKSVEIRTDMITIPKEAVDYLKNVQVLDQSTIRISGDKTVYIDPFNIEGKPHDADIILITHTHWDHFDLESIKNIMNDSTVLYVPKDGVEEAAKNGVKNIIEVMPNQDYTEGSISFKTVPAYNLPNEIETRQYHSKESNWVGYVVTVNSISYYAPGDTDYVPELKGLKADVAFLPMDGIYNMNVEEAAQMANAISPKIAVPYHYNNFSTEDKALEFTSLIRKDIIGTIMTYKMY